MRQRLLFTVASLALVWFCVPCFGGIGRADPVFLPPASYAVGRLPEQVLVGDLDADGFLDLVTANNLSDSVSVLLGNGDGSFDPAVHFAAGYRPTSVALGDLDEDGHVDLAVGNPEIDAIDLLFGNGDGTFEPPVPYNLYRYPLSVTVGDFNRDGHLDLAATNATAPSPSVSVIMGNGDGTFQSAVNYATGTFAMYVTAGDVNGDGIADLLTANWGSNSISILIGRGDGGFEPAVTIGSGSELGPSCLDLADLDRDGDLDIAVAKTGLDPYSPGNVSVLKGIGDGTFQPPENYATHLSPSGVALGDLDRDGVLDMAVANNGSNDFSVFVGNGDGSFQAPLHFAAGYGPWFVALGDLDTDGDLDVVVANGGGDTVTVSLNVSPPGCADADGDGYGDPASEGCQHPELDCDDGNPEVHPGTVEECGQLTCADGLDNDCNGRADALDPACTQWCPQQVRSSTVPQGKTWGVPASGLLAFLLVPAVVAFARRSLSRDHFGRGGLR